MNELVELIRAMRKELLAHRQHNGICRSTMQSVGQFPLIGGKHGGGGRQRFRAEVPIDDVKAFWLAADRLPTLTAETDRQIALVSDLIGHRTLEDGLPESDTPEEVPRSSVAPQDQANKEPSKRQGSKRSQASTGAGSKKAE